MPSKLTDSAVAKLKSKNGKRTDYPDGLIAGLMLRVSPDGSRSFSLTFRVKGGARKRRLTLGTYPVLKLGEAREQARAVLLVAKSGRDPVVEKQLAERRASDTIGNVVTEFGKRYLEAQNRTPRYVKNVRRTLDIHVLPKWGAREIASITRRDAINLLDGIMDRQLPIAANKTLAALRKLFSWALTRDIIQTNPIVNIEPPGAEIRRDRTLANDEIHLVWAALEDLAYPFGHFFKLALVTGQRRTEVSGMRWCDIDEIAKTWTLPAELTKSQRTHIVPLSLLALEILADSRRKALKLSEKLSPYVFTRTGDRPITGYSKVKARLDQRIAELLQRTRLENIKPMEPWTIHDVRRTVGTGLGKLGVPRFHIARVLNHADASVTGIYDRHEYLGEKRDGLDAWGAFIQLVALLPPAQLSELDRLVQLVSRDVVCLGAQAAAIGKFPSLGEVVKLAELDRTESTHHLGQRLRELIDRGGENVVQLRTHIASPQSDAAPPRSVAG